MPTTRKVTPFLGATTTLTVTGPIIIAVTHSHDADGHPIHLSSLVLNADGAREMAGVLLELADEAEADR